MANFVEKENIFLKIAKYLFPWKGDGVVEIVRKVIFLGAAVVLVISIISLATTTGNKIVDTQNNEELSDIYHGTTDDAVTSGSTTVNIDTSKREELQKEFPEVQERFLPLLEINEDIVGWISIGEPEDPFIDYVVVQGDDNDFYLTHNYKKEKSVSGAIFADYRDPITAESTPANTILYGHNMMSGEYFAQLLKYYNYRPTNDGMNFYKKYPTINFSTLYKDSTYKIFGGMLVNTRKSEGDVFYYLEERQFGNKAAFDEYVAKILDRTTFYTDVDLKYGDNLLTLSTCISDYDGKNRGLRWVLFAREVREGEDPAVDVSKAYENPDPLYFDYYYDLNGGSWGGRKWPAEMIQGYSY